MSAPSEIQRELEALLFAATEPLDERTLQTYLSKDGEMSDKDSLERITAELLVLQKHYQQRGVHLVNVAGKWAFTTALDLCDLLQRHKVVPRKLSKAALETLAIIAYHQPTTRAEIEEIRGVATSKGTLDVLMETSWVRPRGRRMTPGRPITYGTSEAFLHHFGFDSIAELPGLADLKAAGLLDSNLPADFLVPSPRDSVELQQDELPLDSCEE